MSIKLYDEMMMARSIIESEYYPIEGVLCVREPTLKGKPMPRRKLFQHALYLLDGAQADFLSGNEKLSVISFAVVCGLLQSQGFMLVEPPASKRLPAPTNVVPFESRKKL